MLLSPLYIAHSKVISPAYLLRTIIPIPSCTAVANDYFLPLILQKKSIVKYIGVLSYL